MTDVFTPEKRSQIMAGIKGKDTRPEIVIRKALHARGFRYRLHVKSLPGKPDLVFSQYNAVIMVQGCFWHGHDCNLFKWPKTRTEFWRGKIEGNRERDRSNYDQLKRQGWRVLEIWECALKGKARLPVKEIIDISVLWLYSDNLHASVTGTDARG